MVVSIQLASADSSRCLRLSISHNKKNKKMGIVIGPTSQKERLEWWATMVMFKDSLKMLKARDEDFTTTIEKETNLLRREISRYAA